MSVGILVNHLFEKVISNFVNIQFVGSIGLVERCS